MSVATSIVRPTAGLLALLLLMLMPLLPTSAQDEDASGSAGRESDGRPPADDPAGASARPRSRREPVVYRPPRRGSPRGRVAGATRSAPALPAPLALAPDHVAHTLSPSPSLFWHVDGVPPENARAILTLVASDAGEPLLEAELPLPEAPGIQRIDLADHGVVLEPEVEVAWSISLRPDGDHPADDAVSTGYVRRVTGASRGEPPTTASGFAEAGLWYDALASLSDAIAADPADPELRAARNSLLRQAKLEAAVE